MDIRATITSPKFRDLVAVHKDRSPEDVGRIVEKWCTVPEDFTGEPSDCRLIIEAAEAE